MAVFNALRSWEHDIMSLDPSFLLSLAAGGLAGFLGNKKQEAPIIPPTIVLPSPVAAPNAPLNPSMTAAPIRSRLENPGRGNSDIVLSSIRSRRDDPSSINRTTLLGGV